MKTARLCLCFTLFIVGCEKSHEGNQPPTADRIHDADKSKSTSSANPPHANATAARRQIEDYLKNGNDDAAHVADQLVALAKTGNPALEEILKGSSITRNDALDDLLIVMNDRPDKISKNLVLRIISAVGDLKERLDLTKRVLSGALQLQTLSTIAATWADTDPKGLWNSIEEFPQGESQKRAYARYFEKVLEDPLRYPEALSQINQIAQKDMRAKSMLTTSMMLKRGIEAGTITRNQILNEMRKSGFSEEDQNTMSNWLR